MNHFRVAQHGFRSLELLPAFRALGSCSLQRGTDDRERHRVRSLVQERLLRQISLRMQLLALRGRRRSRLNRKEKVTLGGANQNLETLSPSLLSSIIHGREGNNLLKKAEFFFGKCSCRQNLKNEEQFSTCCNPGPPVWSSRSPADPWLRPSMAKNSVTEELGSNSGLESAAGTTSKTTSRTDGDALNSDMPGSAAAGACTTRPRSCSADMRIPSGTASGRG